MDTYKYVILPIFSYSVLIMFTKKNQNSGYYGNNEFECYH